MRGWALILLTVAAAAGGCGRTETRRRPAAARAKPPAARQPVTTATKPSSRPSRPSTGPERRAVPPAARPEDDHRLHLRVVGVHDGDTLAGLDDSKTRFKIRLHAIDAPELGQAHGEAAKQALSGKVFGKDVVVIPKTIDQYGRTIGQVLVDGRDVNMEMLREGMAWHYEHFDDDERRREAERAARAAGLGLWQDRAPEPPWDYRRQEKRRKDAPGKR